MIPGDRSHEPSTKRCWKHGAAPVIGLTGGVASGKSSVANLLTERGFTVIDADSVGHEVLDLKDVQRALVGQFGQGVLAKSGRSTAGLPRVDRKTLAAIVFADPKARQDLEAIVHPLMRERFVELIEKALGDGRPVLRPVVLDAAILLESGWNDLCDLVVFVDAARSERIRRAAESRGWSDGDFAARERAQWPCEQKRLRADFVIRNNAGPDSLRPEIETLLATLAEAVPNLGARAPQVRLAELGTSSHAKEGTGSGAWQNPCPTS